jgi:hypothetical protein
MILEIGGRLEVVLLAGLAVGLVWAWWRFAAVRRRP